jgi:hypothetical protein
MKLLLSNEADCRFFKFWFDERICDGINYQGEMFLQLHTFSARRRDQAYEMGSKLLEQGISVIISCSKKQYILGINLRGDWWHDESAQQLLNQIRDLETAGE